MAVPIDLLDDSSSSSSGLLSGDIAVSSILRPSLIVDGCSLVAILASCGEGSRVKLSSSSLPELLSAALSAEVHSPHSQSMEAALQMDCARMAIDAIAAN